MLVLHFLDQKVRGAEVVMVLVDRVGFHCRCHLHRLNCLLQVVLGRLVDVVGCVEIFPFFFLYLSGGSEMVSDYFLHVDRELVVYLLPLYVRGTPSPLEAMMVPCEWVKKDW